MNAASDTLLGLACTCLFLSICRDGRLVHHPVGRATVRATLQRFSIAGVAHLVTIGLSFLSEVLTLAVHGLLAICDCFDQLAPAGAKRPAPGS